jgi:hypothetical protein
MIEVKSSNWKPTRVSMVLQMSDDRYDELFAWLKADEAKSRPYRTNRLKLLLEIFSSSEPNVVFHGGEDSYRMYLELRLAFIHGLYYSVIVLALSCIEHELAGALYAQGVDSSARASLENLLISAQEEGLIDSPLCDRINSMRNIRNARAHFRTPLHPTGTVLRALHEDMDIHELSEQDAITALRLLASLIAP